MEAFNDERTSVVFDLFGTLVPQFPRVEHDLVLDECSALVGLDSTRCRTAWRELYPARVRGEVAGIRGHLNRVADAEGLVLDPVQIAHACEQYRRFIRVMLTPKDGALDMLGCLSDARMRVGLLSNAHDDVADAFETTALASFFTTAVFSCRIGCQKPEQPAFAAVREELGCSTDDLIIFVGDGSDEELSGASLAGMHPVLLRTDLSNAYDAARPDVERWTGYVIHALDELPALLRRFGRPPNPQP